MTLTLSEQLHALHIAHSPAVPLGTLSTHLVPAAARHRIQSLLLEAEQKEPRATLWIGEADTLPVWREQMKFAAPLSPGERARMYAHAAHLIARRVEVADVIEGMDMPAAQSEEPPRLPSREERLGHARALQGMESDAQAPALLLAQSPDARPESLLLTLGFGGTDLCPAPGEHLAVLAYWQALWGARLIACTPTMLEVHVLRRPISWRDAFELAQEHVDYCPPLMNRSAAALRTRAAALRTEYVWRFEWP